MNTREIMAEVTFLLHQVADSYLRIAQAHGLTYNGLMMLYMVEENEHLTQKMVCDRLFLSKSSVHSILESLMDKGLLFLSDGRNRKEKNIVMTEKGRKFMVLVDQDTESIENAGVHSISEEDMNRFLSVSHAFADRMKEEADKIYKISDRHTSGVE